MSRRSEVDTVMTDQSNEDRYENSYKDAQREYDEADREFETAKKRCILARQQADKFKWICRQPVPKGIHSLVLCLPYIRMDFRADSICKPCSNLALEVDRKYEEFLKETKRQARETKKKSEE